MGVINSTSADIDLLARLLRAKSRMRKYLQILLFEIERAEPIAGCAFFI